MHMPTLGPVSYPATTAVRKSLPEMPVRVSARAMSGGSTTEAGCITASRCTSSSSKPWTCVPLHRVALRLESLNAVPQTAQSRDASTGSSVSLSSLLHSRSDAYRPHPRPSRISSLARCLTSAGMSSNRRLAMKPASVLVYWLSISGAASSLCAMLPRLHRPFRQVRAIIAQRKMYRTRQTARLCHRGDAVYPEDRQPCGHKRSAPFKRALLDSGAWWSWGDSNPLPFDCQSNALPIELQPQAMEA